MKALQLFRGMGDYQRAIDAVAPPAATAASAQLPRQVGPLSVLSDQSALQAVVWADLTTGQPMMPTRDVAMSIPAMARQRHLLCGTVARCPLVQVGPAAPLRPYWIARTDRLASEYHRLLWTVDDLIFHGWSVWQAERGYANPGQLGQLLAVTHLSRDRWETDEFGRIIVDGEVAQDGEVIAIPGPHEGVLNFGRGALARTVANLDSAQRAAQNPSAYLELHYTGDDPMTDDDIDALVARWAAARRGENGGVAFTNKYLEVREHGTHESHLLIEGRNADAVDVSRLVSSPAAMADATNAGASLTYETTEGRNAELLDYGVGLYMDAIAARLSLDDVTPRGSRVTFDTTELRALSPSPTDTDSSSSSTEPTPTTTTEVTAP